MPRYDVTFAESRHGGGEVDATDPHDAIEVARRYSYDSDLTEIDFWSVEVVDATTGRTVLVETD